MPRLAPGFLASLSAVLVIVTTARCGGDGATTPDEDNPDPDAPIATLRVTPSATFLDSGSTVRLSVEARSASGTLLAGRTVTWSSTDPLVSTVSETGIVSGLSVGEAFIIAAAGGARDSAGVTVRRGAANWGRSTPMPVSPGSEFVAISAGAEHTCALTAAGRVWCWGYGRSRLPVEIAGETVYSSIVTSDGMGVNHTCALDLQGAAYCWGNNGSGQLGIGSTSETPLPTPVLGGFRFTKLALGQRHTCGLTQSGDAYCWGENSTGNLGDGTDVQRPIPTPVVGGLSFVSITAGNEYTCALTAAGDTYCWGGNRNGELGLGFTSPRILSPSRIMTSVRFTSIHSGLLHVCALTATQEAYCWGWNQWRQLGRTGPTVGESPGLVDGINLVAISGGFFHTCALDAGGEAHCWGVSGFGQLGNGLPVDPTGPPVVMSSPTAVVGGHRFQSISAGNSHTCAITTARAVYCWGHHESGALGIP